MRFFVQALIAILAVAQLAVAAPKHPMHGPKQPPSARPFYHGGDQIHAGDVLTIEVENRLPHNVTLHTITGRRDQLPQIPSFIGRPDESQQTLKKGQNYTFYAPSGFQGNIWAADASTYASKMEFSFLTDDTQQGYADISYVDGYSHPITCSKAGTPKTKGVDQPFAGCNIDLWAHNECPKEHLTAWKGEPSKFCRNPTNIPEGLGPPTAFFAPCRGSAYTFPKDDLATHGLGQSRHVKCCIGHECPASPDQLIM